MGYSYAEEQAGRAKASTPRDVSRERGSRPPDASKPVVRRQRAGAALPDDLQAAVERLSGRSMDDVRVHYDSSKPTRIQALAYSQGQDIELASGQEQHLAHEAWHVVQQMQGRVRPTQRIDSVSVNDDQRLEREADVMGARASVLGRVATPDGQPTRIASSTTPMVAQRVRGLKVGDDVITMVNVEVEPTKFEDYPYDTVIVGVSEDGNTYTIKYVEEYCQSDPSLPKEVAESRVRPRKGKLPLAKAPEGDKSKAPWVDPALGLDPEALEKVGRIAGEARQLNWLSEEQLEEMIEFFSARKDKPSEKQTQLLKDLSEDLETIRKTNEPADQVLARAEAITKEITSLENDAFKAQFGIDIDGATWTKMYDAVLDWYAQVKVAESKADDDAGTFAALYTANRMTARQINLRKTAYGERWNVKRYDRKATGPEREMYLDKTVAGIGKRGDPSSFLTDKTKNEQGVHDLSASLLSASKGDIFHQLKPYKEAVVLFMPLPEEKDLQILSAVARIRDIPKHWVEVFSDLITHPRYAQSSDMGATFTDTAPDAEQLGSFQYGITGTVVRKTGDRARKINAADMAARRRGALTYTKVATDMVTKVNEIVMACRTHSSKRFPMFARWDGDEKGNGRFIEVKAPSMTDTKMVITNAGVYQGA